MGRHEFGPKTPGIIIEDEPTHAEIVKSFLQDNGIANEPLVLTELDREKITPSTEFVILDIGLGDTDPQVAMQNSLDFVNALQTDDRRDVPVVIVTAFDVSEKYRKDLKDAGAQGIINKPFTEEALQEQLNKIRERSSGE